MTQSNKIEMDNVLRKETQISYLTYLKESFASLRAMGERKLDIVKASKEIFPSDFFLKEIYLTDEVEKIHTAYLNMIIKHGKVTLLSLGIELPDFDGMNGMEIIEKLEPMVDDALVDLTQESDRN